MKANYIIVGQGLAGTLLANELIRLGQSLVVFDDPNQIKSSDVAAGLINPAVFRRMTKSWMLDHAFPQMETTYLQLEDLLNQKLYFPNQIYRILSEEEASSGRREYSPIGLAIIWNRNLRIIFSIQISMPHSELGKL